MRFKLRFLRQCGVPGLAAIVVLMAASLPAFAASPSGYADAQRAFDQLPVTDRLTFKVALTATGYWPAIADADFSRKLFEATTQYQADNGLAPNGVIDKDLLAEIYRSSSPLLGMWGFRQIAHPYRGHPIWVPMGLGLLAERDQNGLTWRDPLKRVWLTYDYLREANLAAAYNSVVAKVVADGGQIAFKILKDDYFIVSSSTNGLDSYIRCQADHPGLLWLSLFWLHNASDLHIERVATLMSGSLASTMSGAPFADVPELPSPQLASPSASPPDTVGAAPTDAREAPRLPEQREKEGTSGVGFFVNSDGDVVTNAHLVENCARIAVARDQIAAADATLVARDAVNDLAVLKTAFKTARAARIRSRVSPGEAVETLGLVPSLSGSSSLADGNVTALAGVSGDTRYLQISTPIRAGDAGAPLFDQSGNVVGIVSAKSRAPNMVVATAGDIPPDINFAIKGSLVASFLESNGIPFAEGAALREISDADLAEQARALSVSVSCR
ncbi:MAG: trypsin-like peptidase domain-containing protein [Methylocella sp.]